MSFKRRVLVGLSRTGEMRKHLKSKMANDAASRMLDESNFSHSSHLNIHYKNWTNYLQVYIWTMLPVLSGRWKLASDLRPEYGDYRNPRVFGVNLTSWPLCDLWQRFSASLYITPASEMRACTSLPENNFTRRRVLLVWLLFLSILLSWMLLFPIFIELNFCGN